MNNKKFGKREIKSLRKLVRLHEGLDVHPGMRGISRDLRTAAYPVAGRGGKVTWYKQVIVQVESDRRVYRTLQAVRVRRPAAAASILAALAG